MCASSAFPGLPYSPHAASPKAGNHRHDICRAHFALHSHLLSNLTSGLWARRSSQGGELQKTLLGAAFQLPGLLSSLALRNHGILEWFRLEGALKAWFQPLAMGREPSARPGCSGCKPEKNSQGSWVFFCHPWLCCYVGNAAEFLF